MPKSYSCKFFVLNVSPDINTLERFVEVLCLRKGSDQSRIPLIRNVSKTRTSKVGAISKAQKAQNIFFWKKLIFFSFKKKSHSAEKCKRGTLLDLLTYILLQNNKKTQKGGPFGTLQNVRKKVAQCRKKSNGGPFSLGRFFRLRLKWTN